jgi:hypothetical protein
VINREFWKETGLNVCYCSIVFGRLKSFDIRTIHPINKGNSPGCDGGTYSAIFIIEEFEEFGYLGFVVISKGGGLG